MLLNEFLPAGRVTGIGSLPHTNLDEAVQFVAEHSPELPFWPQLPCQTPDASMLGQMVAPLRDLLDWRSPARLDLRPGTLPEFRRRLLDAPAQLDVESAGGFFAFERACATGMFPRAVAYKAQLTGPLTLACCLFDAGRPLAALPAVQVELGHYLARLGQWQIERLRAFGKPVLLFVDEPALGLGNAPAGLDQTLTRLINSLRATGAYVGLHSCAASTPDVLCAHRPDILSFDAHTHLEPFLASPLVRDFVTAGGWLALGLIPTWAQLDTFAQLEPFARWAQAVHGWDAIGSLARQTLVTATCGLGLLDVPAARASFEKAHAVSRLFGRLARDGERRLDLAVPLLR